MNDYLFLDSNTPVIADESMNNETVKKLWNSFSLTAGTLCFEKGEKYTFRFGTAQLPILPKGKEYALKVDQAGIAIVGKDYGGLMRGFIALLICGMEVSVISLIGFIMLTGIIVNNGIVLVDYINQLRQEGMERRQAIIEAGTTRMRPILMTTITTILGLVDMATNDAAGTAMMQPIAVVCIGGLIYATLMTLFVVPCIYDMLNKKELRNVREEDLKMLDI